MDGAGGAGGCGEIEALLLFVERKEENLDVVLGRLCKVASSPELGVGGNGSLSLSFMEAGGEVFNCEDLSRRSSSS